MVDGIIVVSVGVVHCRYFFNALNSYLASVFFFQFRLRTKPPKTGTKLLQIIHYLFVSQNDSQKTRCMFDISQIHCDSLVILCTET